MWDGRIQANALHIPMPDNSVHCVVTSPPYYGLRSYEISPTIWGGSTEHDHKWNNETSKAEERALKALHRTGRSNVSDQSQRGQSQGRFCDCGAWLGCLGLEPTVQMFVDNVVLVFREIRRVLRRDGTCFMNMGDSYNSGTSSGRNPTSTGKHGYWQNPAINRRINVETLAPKNLLLMPHRVTIALQDDGWIVRNDIVWEKSQCMPESVRDRCTRSHEYVFHLTKSDRYYWDAEAIKEPASEDTHARYARGRSADHKYADGGPGNQTISRSFEHMVVDKQAQLGKRTYTGFNERWNQKIAGVHPKAAPAGSGIKQNESFNAAVKDVVSMRNKRTVWRLGTAAFSEAHYATFNPDLVHPCVLAGTSAYGCCVACGAPYTRILKPSERYAKYLGKGFHDHGNDDAQGMMQSRGENRQNKMRDETGNHCAEYETQGWQPGCTCNAAIVPCVVLDPFFGSGTVGMVCEQLNRRWIGLDLGYQEMQGRRVKNVQKRLLDV